MTHTIPEIFEKDEKLYTPELPSIKVTELLCWSKDAIQALREAVELLAQSDQAWKDQGIEVPWPHYEAFRKKWGLEK